MLTVNNNVYIIVIYGVITVNYCKCILLHSPVNSYLYVHYILDLKKILIIYYRIPINCVLLVSDILSNKCMAGFILARWKIMVCVLFVLIVNGFAYIHVSILIN